MLGLNIIFAHLGYQNTNLFWEVSEVGNKEEQRYINDIIKCSSNGFKLIIIHPTTGFTNPGMNQIGINRLKRIIKVANDYNVKVAFENVELIEYLNYIMENIDEQNAGVCFDVGYCHVFSNDIVNTNLLKNRLFVIHLHDNYKENDDHNMPFDGNVDWNKYMKKIVDMNYDGYIILECGYSNYYSKISLDEYYKKAYERGIKLLKLYQFYRNK